MPIHPGEFLAEILEEQEISQAQFARAIGVAELALLFGRALGQSPQYWLNLQTAYDLKQAEMSIGEQLSALVELMPTQ